jgi:hypothetical protein
MTTPRNTNTKEGSEAGWRYQEMWKVKEKKSRFVDSSADFYDFVNLNSRHSYKTLPFLEDNEIGSHYVVKAGLELSILQPQPPQC